MLSFYRVTAASFGFHEGHGEKQIERRFHNEQVVLLDSEDTALKKYAGNFEVVGPPTWEGARTREELLQRRDEINRWRSDWRTGKLALAGVTDDQVIRVTEDRCKTLNNLARGLGLQAFQIEALVEGLQ